MIGRVHPSEDQRGPPRMPSLDNQEAVRHPAGTSHNLPQVNYRGSADHRAGRPSISPNINYAGAVGRHPSSSNINHRGVRGHYAGPPGMPVNISRRSSPPGTPITARYRGAVTYRLISTMASHLKPTPTPQQLCITPSHFRSIVDNL